MEHKGLIYTLSGTFLLAFFIGLIAFSLGRGERIIVLESSPSGAQVYINGEFVGKTPYEFNPYFLKRHQISDRENFPLMRVVIPFSDGFVLNTPKGSSVVQFALSGAGDIPTIFDKTQIPNAAVADKIAGKMDFFILSSAADKITAVFEKSPIPALDDSIKLNSEIYAFKGEREDISVMELSEFKSFKVKSRGETLKQLLGSAKNSKASNAGSEVNSSQKAEKVQNAVGSSSALSSAQKPTSAQKNPETSQPEKPLTIDDFKELPDAKAQ